MQSVCRKQRMLRKLLVYDYTERAVQAALFLKGDNMNNRYKKSTLRAWNLTDQTAAENENLQFTNSQKTGCAIRFANGTGSVTIEKPGIYQIDFNAVASEDGTVGNIIAQLQKNGENVKGAFAEANSAATTAVVNLAFSTIIEIPQSCACINNAAVLTVENAGVAALYTNANIIVTKLC